MNCRECKHAKLNVEPFAQNYQCKHLDRMVAGDNRCADFVSKYGSIKVIPPHYNADGSRIVKHKEVTANDLFIEAYTPVVTKIRSRKHSHTSRGQVTKHGKHRG